MWCNSREASEGGRTPVMFLVIVTVARESGVGIDDWRDALLSKSVDCILDQDQQLGGSSLALPGPKGLVLRVTSDA